MTTGKFDSFKALVSGATFDKISSGDVEAATDIPKFEADAVYNNILENYFKDPVDTFKDLNGLGITLEKIFSNLSGSSDYLKSMKNLNGDADKVFKKAIASIKKAQKSDKGNEVYSAMNKAVSSFQASISGLTSGIIRALRKGISEDRALIATLVAYNPAKTESAMLEFAYATGFDALHEETEGETMEDIEAAAKEEGINIDITVSGDVDADVTVNDETDDAPAADEPDAE